MSQISATGAFRTANPHALAAILEASETKSIIAADDIFDISGIKLWARDQPVSQDLQRKLMDRALSKPLETCLVAEDGVTTQSLLKSLHELLQSEGGALAPFLKPYAATLLKAAANIRLHPVVQLLLSASESARPQAYAHAVEAMAVAGTLMIRASRGEERLITQAMTAGLLHDVGEMYIAPEHGEADAAATLNVESYRQLVVHPHIGQLLLTQLTDYSKDIARAVGEHHEHLDGSGYPHMLRGEQMSPLGRLLATVEAALAALRMPGATLHHASVALRVVPGEFDEHLAGPLAAAARKVAPMQAKRSLPDLSRELARLDTALQTSMSRIDTLIPAEASDSLQKAASLTRFLVHKLRSGWNESGLWASQVGAEEAAEAEAVQDALRARLQEIERVARLTAGTLEPDEADALDLMCAGLVEDMA